MSLCDINPNINKTITSTILPLRINLVISNVLLHLNPAIRHYSLEIRTKNEDIVLVETKISAEHIHEGDIQTEKNLLKSIAIIEFAEMSRNYIMTC
jgi:hypothetical protein